MILLRCLALLLVMTGCTPEPPAPEVHYVLGAPYQSDGVWYYPREDFAFDETGLAAVITGAPAPVAGRTPPWMAQAVHTMPNLAPLAAAFAGAGPPLTADGEVFDQTALAAAHPTLQLPALARITNLENGRQVVVRINDRRPSSPDRLIEITRRTAELLAAADPQAIRVRVQVLEGPSRLLAGQAHTDAPPLAVAAAPAGVVLAETLPLPRGAAQAGGVPAAPTLPRPAAAADPPDPTVPLRLPEAVTQVAVRPTSLLIDCGDFSDLGSAALLQSRVARLGAHLTTSYDAPRDRAYMVRIGPLPTVAAAEAMRRRATAAGATDARIVVE